MKAILPMANVPVKASYSSLTGTVTRDNSSMVR